MMDKEASAANKDYLTDLAAKVRTIQDDIIGEQLDVDSQLVRVKTAVMDFKNFKLSALQEFYRLANNNEESDSSDVTFVWKRCNAEDLKEGDIISDDGVLRRIATNPLNERFQQIYVTSADDDTREHFFVDVVSLRKFDKIEDIQMGCASSAWKAVDDVKDAAMAILQNTTPVLVVAGPGTGKTWFLQQLCHMLLVIILEQESIDQNTLLPVLIPVQKLARLSRQAETRKSKDEMDLIQTFLESQDSQHAPLLKEKLANGKLILLIDGMDEAAGMKETIESLVLKSLLLTGNRIVVTSRPEGVRLPLYYQDFAILNLLPLSIHQQLDVIKRFTKGNEFLASLFNLLDRTYEKHFTKYHKGQVESITPFDGFKLENGEWDPTKRQSAIDGSEISETTAIQSTFLRTLQKGLDEGNLLSHLEQELEDLVSNHQRLTDSNAREIVQMVLENGGVHSPDLVTVCTRLCLLRVNTDQDNMDMVQLWNHIVSRTDSLYVSAEHFLPIFDKLLSTLKDQCGEDDLQIKMGPMKDPIRVFEKAQCDYASRFTDALPESCVVDLLRVRLICPNSQAIYKIWKVLQDAKLDGLDGNTVVRLKNMFHPRYLTPTHYRFMILSLQLSDGGARFMAEVQLQHSEIMKKEAEADGHTAYEYFRSVLKDRYQMVLENALQSPRVEESLSQFESMAKVPVLLSLIVVILVNEGAEDPLGALQSSKYDLYEKAMACILRLAVGEKERKKVWKMLELVSVSNMRAQRRIFDLNDVRMVLIDGDNNVGLFEKWLELQDSSSGIPLVKILSERSQSDASSAEYQFKHLSFSEALYFKHLTSPAGVTISSEEAIKLIRDPFYLNTIRFGHGAIARALHLHLQESISLDGFRKESIKNLETLIKASPCEFESIFGIFVGSGEPTVAAERDNYKSKYTHRWTTEIGLQHYYKITRGNGVLYAMIRGDLSRVKDFVVAHGNLPVCYDGEDLVTSTYRFCYESLDGFGIYEEYCHRQVTDKSLDICYHNWDGQTEMDGLKSLLEVAICSLQLPVARAIQDGLKERGEQYRIGIDRLLELLAKGVDSHANVRKRGRKSLVLSFCAMLCCAYCWFKPDYR